MFDRLVSDRSPPETRGPSYGIFNLFTGVALLAASVIAGVVWDAAGANLTFTVGTAFAGTALAGSVLSSSMGNTKAQGHQKAYEAQASAGCTGYGQP